jgi:hypothetical protein
MKILKSRFFGRIKLYREINILVYGKKKKKGKNKTDGKNKNFSRKKAIQI